MFCLNFDIESAMWSIIQHNNCSGPFLTGQMRDFDIHFENNVSISPNTSFRIPNFVNSLPHFENRNSVKGNCQIDTKNQVDQASTRNNCLTNSSQSIIDTLKKNHMDIVRDTAPNFKASDNKREHRNCRKKAQINSLKKSNHRQITHNMMEIDIDQVYMNASDTKLCPKEQTMLKVADFIVNIPCDSSDNESESSDNEDSFVVFQTGTNDKLEFSEEESEDEILLSHQRFVRERKLSTTSEDSFVVFETGADDKLEFSEEESEDEIILPHQRFVRERNLSTTSEDSFVVFESGTDDELEMSREEESDEEDDLEVEDDFDSSSSVIPCKRVRFAAKEDLCEIHPMIQWSFAYRKARKGPWEEYARDRSRFKKRIGDVEKTLASIFDCKHRERMYQERFVDKRTD